MSVIYAQGLKSTRMQDTIDAIDAGAGPATMEIGVAGMGLVLVTLTLSKPSFTEAFGTITMAAMPKNGVAVSSGTAAAARIRDFNGNVVVSGLTVGTSGADINLSSVSILNGQTVTLSSFTMTHS